MPQSTGWLSVISCSICLRRVRTRGESVSTRMPLATGMLQAMSSQPCAVPSPSTSTMQMRQLPGTERAGCQQKYGMTWPLARAACMTVWPSLASTRSPSMKISTIDRLRDRPLGALRLEPAVVRRRDRDQAVDVVELALAGDDAVDDPVQPAHPLAARRALAARLVVVE